MIPISSILFILLGPVLWISIALVVIYLVVKRVEAHDAETFEKRDH